MIRRKCLNQVIVLGETHLRRILIHAAYYTCVQSLHKDASSVSVELAMTSSRPTGNARDKNEARYLHPDFRH
jgi:hypothetical protein